MKSKIYKICGVALALVLVFGLFGAFVPVRQIEAQGPATTPNMWQTVSLPSAGLFKVRAADVADFAVASDGKTIYAIDTQTAAILKSPNNGGRWQALVPPVGITNPPRLIAVAPDDPNAIAIIDSATPAGFSAGSVWISSNGGTTWAQLAFVPGAATNQVMDIALGPARAGTILDRDFAVAVADTAAGLRVNGDILFMGLTTAWQSCVAAGVFAPNTFDFTSLAMSPGFLGDRCIVAVGSSAAGTSVSLIRTSDVVPVATLIAPPGTQVLETSVTVALSPNDLNFAGVPWGAPVVVPRNIFASDVALPADFDPTIPSGMRTFVSWASATFPAVGVDDVYRQDFMTTRKLESGTATGIFSIAFSGTIAGGTLIAGDAGLTLPIYTMVYRTEDPQVSQPSWAASAKSPTGVTNCVVGIDPANPTLCYAGNSGVESAFSRSNNGGVSFNQVGLINTEYDVLQDVMVSPDGAEIFLATSDNGVITATGSASTLESLWWSSLPNSGTSWERIRISPVNWGDNPGDSIIRLSPEWDDTPSLYWCDQGAPLIVNDIQRSVDGGDVFGQRSAPALIQDVTVENEDILYMASGGNVYQSTNGAWFFNLPVATGIPAAIYDIAMAPTYPEKPIAGNLLIGGIVAGGVFLSTNSGASWRPLSSFIAGGTNMQVTADVNFATNDTVYAADNTAGSGIWRYVVGTSTVWENIGSPAGLATAMPAAATMTGLAHHCGTLYGSWAAAAAVAVTVNSEPIQAVVTVALAGDVDGLPESFTLDYVNQGTAAATTPAVLIPNNAALGATFPITLAVLDTGVMDVTPTAGSVIVLSDVAAGTVDIVGTLTGTVYGTMTLGARGLYADGAIPAWPVAIAVGAGSGADRSLVPTLPVIANWIFESMDVGSAAANFNSTPNALRVAGTADEVSLWAINTIANALMAYDDTMAKVVPALTVPDVVPIDPVTGRNAEFNITWPGWSNATTFQIEIFNDSACTQRVLASGAGYIPPNPLSPAYVVLANTLVAGTDYWVKVRTRNQTPGDAIRSGWSKVIKFTVAGGERVEVSYLGVQPLGPVPGATDVPLSPGFTWSPYAQSTKYEFQLATDAGFTDILAETKVAATGYKYDGTLSYATTYFWKARGIEPTVTDWSPVSSFTTEKKPVPPVVVEPTPAPPVPEPVVTPGIIWAIIAIGAILVIAVIVLILRTRRVA